MIAIIKHFVKELVDFRFILVPLAVTRTTEGRYPISYVGYLRVRIFGLQVAKIQETKPWQNS